MLLMATVVSSVSALCLSELMQTEMHHIRTLRIMSEVYSKGLQKELQLELQTVEKLFPALDELLDLHTQHLLRLLERKRESQLEGGNLDGAIVISRIGDLLVNQVRVFKDDQGPKTYFMDFYLRCWFTEFFSATRGLNSKSPLEKR